MQRIYLSIFLALLVSGCAVTPTPTQTIELQKYLGDSCYELITRPGIANYNFHATHPFPLVHAYFALASDSKDKQVCSFTTTTMALGRENNNRVAALGSCNELRTRYGIQAPCKIFARNYEIVYDKASTHGME